MNNRLIGVVGPCSAGKSTLIAGLSHYEYGARHIAQEHSCVPDMWKRITKPDVLIFLDVSYEESMRRRPMDMTEEEFDTQNQRLNHARDQADLYINTEIFTADDVLAQVMSYLMALDETTR